MDSAVLAARKRVALKRSLLHPIERNVLLAKRTKLQLELDATDLKVNILDVHKEVVDEEIKLIEMMESSSALKEDLVNHIIPPAKKRIELNSCRVLLSKVEKELGEARKAGEEMESLCVAARKEIDDLQVAKVAALDLLEEKRADLISFAKEINIVTAHLPPEVLANIFRFLPLSDMVTAGQVCSTWREVVKSPSVWKKTYLNLCKADRDGLDSDTERILRAAPRLGHVHIEMKSVRSALALARQWKNIPEVEKLSFLTRWNVALKVDPFLTSCSEALSGLDLNGCSTATAEFIDKKFTSLKDLSFRGYYNSALCYVFCDNLTKQSTLVTLSCHNVAPETATSIIIAHSETLQRIRLTQLKSWNGTVNAALRMCKRLKYLKLDCSAAGLELPPWCEAVELVARRHVSEDAPCAVSAALARGAVKQLHLVVLMGASAVVMKWHLKQLGPGFLSSLQQLTLRCKRTLASSQRWSQTFARVAGRSVRVVELTKEDRSVGETRGWAQFC